MQNIIPQSTCMNCTFTMVLENQDSTLKAYLNTDIQSQFLFWRDTSQRNNCSNPYMNILEYYNKSTVIVMMVVESIIY